MKREDLGNWLDSGKLDGLPMTLTCKELVYRACSFCAGLLYLRVAVIRMLSISAAGDDRRLQLVCGDFARTHYSARAASWETGKVGSRPASIGVQSDRLHRFLRSIHQPNCSAARLRRKHAVAPQKVPSGFRNHPRRCHRSTLAGLARCPTAARRVASGHSKSRASEPLFSQH